MRLLPVPLIAAVLCCASSARTAGQDPVWKEVVLPVEDAYVHGMFFVSGSTGWAVGNKGLIFKTSDAGKTWETQRGGDLRELLKGVFFTDANTGWVVGGQGGRHGGDNFPAIVLKTEDAGATWKRVDELLKDADNKSEFWYVRFVGERGWIIGQPRSFITTNGGRTWAPLKLEVVNEQRRAGPQFTSEKLGFDISDTTLFRSTDGGRHWDAEDITEFLPRGGSINTEFFLSDKVGFGVGGVETRKARDTLVIKTEDCAKSWKVLSRVSGKGYAYGVFFANEKEGWLLTHEHQQKADFILRTDDSGKSWTTEFEWREEERGNLGDMFFAADGKTGFVAAPGRLLRRGD